MPGPTPGIGGAPFSGAPDPMPAAILHIPAMTDRASVRAVSATLLDLAGVDAVEADATTGCVTVWGGVSETALRTALAEDGYLVETGPCG